MEVGSASVLADLSPGHVSDVDAAHGDLAREGAETGSTQQAMKDDQVIFRDQPIKAEPQAGKGRAEIGHALRLPEMGERRGS
jgi:hypothetical protein